MLRLFHSDKLRYTSFIDTCSVSKWDSVAYQLRHFSVCLCVCVSGIAGASSRTSSLEEKRKHMLETGECRAQQCLLNLNVIYWQLCSSPIFFALLSFASSLRRLYHFHLFSFNFFLSVLFCFYEQTFDGVRLPCRKVHLAWFIILFVFTMSCRLQVILHTDGNAMHANSLVIIWGHLFGVHCIGSRSFIYDVLSLIS